MERMSVQKLGKSDGTQNPMPVISAIAGVWSRSVKISHGKSFCLSVMATVSSGTPDVDLYIEQTPIEPASITTGEGVVGDQYNGWAQPVGASKVADIIAANTWYHFTVSPVVLEFLRVKAIGQGANPASTTLDIRLTELSDLV